MSKSHCVNLIYVPQLNKVTLNSEKLLSNVFFLDFFHCNHKLCNEISDKSHIATIYGALHMCRVLPYSVEPTQTGFQWPVVQFPKLLQVSY